MAMEDDDSNPAGSEGLTVRPLRIGLVAVAWLLCLPGLGYHVLVLGGVSLVGLLSGEVLVPFNLKEVVAALAILLSVLSWVALARMSVGWIGDRPVHWLWPLAGTALTLPVPLPSRFIAAIFVLPGILLAIYLCVWHLRQASRRGGNSA